MRFVVYARYSSVGQNPLSIDQQIRACRDAAAGRGWREVAGPFSDSARSGFKRVSREGLARLSLYLESAPRGIHVMVWSTSRMARQWGWMMSTMISWHDDYGAQITDCEYGTYDLDTTEGRLMLSLRATMDQEYSEGISRRVKLAHSSLRSAGYFVGPPPFGARIQHTDGGPVLEPDPATHRYLLELFERAPESSTRKLTQWLNASGPPPRYARVWSDSSVNTILRNPAYAGMMRSGGRVIEARHDPIIPLDVWAAAQRAHGADHLRARPRPRKNELSGRVHCHGCGRGCHVMIARDRSYYRCPSLYLGGDCPAPGWIRRHEMVAAIWRTLEAGLPALRELAGSDRPEEPDTLAAEIADKRQQIARIADAIATAPESSALVNKLQTLEEELSSMVVTRAARAGENSVSSLAIKACGIVQNRNPAGLALLVKRIEILPKGSRHFLLSTAGRKSLQLREIPLV